MRPARTRTQQTDSKADRRPGSHPGRRVALTAVIAAVGFSVGAGATAAAAQADDSTTVVVATIYEPGGPTHVSVTAGQLDLCSAYGHAHTTVAENGLQGPVDVDITPAAWSLGTVLDCAMAKAGQGVDPATVNQVQVLDANGNPEDTNRFSTLSAADLAPSSDYEDTTQSPAVGYAGNDSSGGPDVYYYRPPHDSSDLDFLDELTPDGQPLTLWVFTGPQLAVTATASPSGQVDPGTAITFSATVTPTDAANPTYAWSFGPGAASATATGATVNATYEQPGTWSATVVVTDSDGASGTAPVEVDVGPAPTDTGAAQSGTTPTVIATETTVAPVTPTKRTPTKITKKTTTATTTPPPTTTHRATPPPTTTHHATPPPTTTHHATPPPTTTHHATPPPTTTHHATPPPTTTHHATPPPTTTHTTTTPSTSRATPHAATPPSASRTASPSTRPIAGNTVEHHRPHPEPHPTTPQRRRRPAPVARTHGNRVVGRALASVNLAAPGSSPLVSRAPAADTTAPLPTGNRHAATSPSPLAIILSALVVVALLTLGAVNEMRGGIDWRSLRARLPRR